MALKPICIVHPAAYHPLCSPEAHSNKSPSYSPDVARQFFEVAKTIYTKGEVKPRNRELAILGLASVLDTPYIRYCHDGAKAGFTHEQVEECLAGRVPPGLSEEEQLAYRLGRTLTTLNGPLDDATFQEVSAKMSKTEFVGLVHTISGYRWIALLEQVNGDPRWN